MTKGLLPPIVTIEPSNKVSKDSGGVYLRVNSPQELNNLPEGHGCDEAIERINHTFENTLDEAEEIFDDIKKEGLE